VLFLKVLTVVLINVSMTCWWQNWNLWEMLTFVSGIYGDFFYKNDQNSFKWIFFFFFLFFWGHNLTEQRIECLIRKLYLVNIPVSKEIKPFTSIYYFILRDKGSLCCPGWPQTPSDSSNSLSSASWVAGAAGPSHHTQYLTYNVGFTVYPLHC
jgi:hypothetical protein